MLSWKFSWVTMRLAWLIAPASVLTGALRVEAQTSPTAFSYQGRMVVNTQAYTGSADISFVLYDAPVGGNALTGSFNAGPVQVNAGLFNVMIDFGTPAFDGTGGRWLETTVTTPSGGANTTTLSRQLIGATPGAAVAFAVPVYSGAPFVPFKGAVRYNDGAGDFQGFNGLYWLSLTGRPTPTLNKQRFASPGTFDFIVPPGVTQLYCEAWGGGGGGGGTSTRAIQCGVISNASDGGGAGGAGAYAASILSVTPGEQLTVQVGAAGARGANTNEVGLSGLPGEAGGDSLVSRAGDAILSAGGGSGGSGGGFGGAADSCALIAGTAAGGQGGSPGGGTYANNPGGTGGAGGAPIKCSGTCYAGQVGRAGTRAAPAFKNAGLPGAEAGTSSTFSFNFFGQLYSVTILNPFQGDAGNGAAADNNPSGAAFASQPGQPGAVIFYWY